MNLQRHWWLTLIAYAHLYITTCTLKARWNYCYSESESLPTVVSNKDDAVIFHFKCDRLTFRPIKVISGLYSSIVKLKYDNKVFSHKDGIILFHWRLVWVHVFLFHVVGIIKYALLCNIRDLRFCFYFIA